VTNQQSFEWRVDLVTNCVLRVIQYSIMKRVNSLSLTFSGVKGKLHFPNMLPSDACAIPCLPWKSFVAELEYFLLNVALNCCKTTSSAAILWRQSSPRSSSDSSSLPESLAVVSSLDFTAGIYLLWPLRLTSQYGGPLVVVFSSSSHMCPPYPDERGLYRGASGSYPSLRCYSPSLLQLVPSLAEK